LNRWKIAFFFAVPTLVLCTGYLLFRLVDAGISYSYLHDSHDEQAAKFEKLGELIVQGSRDYSKADILHLLRQSDPDGFIVEEDDRIHYAGITFSFIDDRLTDIQ
jgi:hypothetical protein